MPVLQAAQGIYGYLPVEVQEMIASGLHLSVAEVYGVVTFYSQFSLNPKGQYRVSVCLGTACYVKGSDKVLEAVENKLGIAGGTASGKKCRKIRDNAVYDIVSLIGNEKYAGGKQESNHQHIAVGVVSGTDGVPPMFRVSLTEKPKGNA